MDANLKRRHTQLTYGRGVDFGPNSKPEPDKKKSKGTSGDTKGTTDGLTQSLKPPQESIPPVPKVVPVRTFTWRTSEPWRTAAKLFEQGSTTVCEGTPHQRSHVAVKERKIDTDEPRPLRIFSHEHIVSLLEAHVSSKTIYFVYEYMDVSLRHIASLTKRLNYHELGLACKAVGAGLSYLHKDLGIAHGNVNCKNVLVDRQGRIKIANVGDALLRDAESRPSFRTDIRGIGLLMVELMEQKTSALNPNDLKVTNPESWTDHPEILAFLANTDTHSLEELLSHPFIPSVADYNCFATYALLAQLSAYIPTSLV